MAKRRKVWVSKIITGTLACLLMTINIYSYLAGNGSGDSYAAPPKSPEAMFDSGTTNPINTFIEKGAACFFKSYSDYLLFSNKIEMSNLEASDYSEWISIIDSALLNIRNAKSNYYQLIQTADATPYNWQIIYRLWFFDYTSFMVRHKLNRIHFWRVQEYLMVGDITGAYIRIYAGIRDIEALLTAVRRDLVQHRMPDLPKMWDVNEEFTNTLTFAQYMTRVFYNL